MTKIDHDITNALVSILGVEINSKVWKEVPSLREAGPDDEAYAVTYEPSGAVKITFGDGEHGRRPPSDGCKIAASYRLGADAAGSVITSTWVFTGQQVRIPLRTQISQSDGVIRIEISQPAQGCLSSLLSWLGIRTE